MASACPAGFEARHSQVKIFVRFVGIDADRLEKILFRLRQISHFVVGEGQVVGWRSSSSDCDSTDVEECFESGAVLAALRQDGGVIGLGVGIVRRPGRL